MLALPKTHRFLLFAIASLFIVGTFTNISPLNPTVAVAQDDADGGDEAKAGAGGEEAGGEDAGGGDAKKGGGSAAKPSKNALQWLFESLGLLYIVVFLILSFTFVALLVMNLLAARRANVCPTSLVEGFEAHLDQKQYQEAYDLSKADDSFLGHVLSAGLGKLSAGYQPSIEAMQEVGEEESMKLHQTLSYLALIGTISPMVGLFGTVHGMIEAFYSIATMGTTPDPGELAGDISKALLTTLLGLAIAIPAIAAYNIIRNWIDRLVLEVGILSEGLMSRFENHGQ